MDETQSNQFSSDVELNESQAHVEVQERNFAFEHRLETFSIVNFGHIEINEFLQDVCTQFEKRIRQAIEKRHTIKIAACLDAIFEKVVISTDGENTEYQQLYLHTTAKILDNVEKPQDFYEEHIKEYILQRIEDVEMRGSGFKLSEIKELNIQISRYDPLRGSSYIKLPKFLSNKKAIINVKNIDQYCFKYAILSALHPAKENVHRVSNYKKFEDELDFGQIQFPVLLCDISKFEDLNVTISINVYMYNEGKKTVHPVYLTKEVKKNHLHLLLLEKSIVDNAEAGGMSLNQIGECRVNMHYCWIKNLSALVSRQLSKNRQKKLFCDRCLNYFTVQEKLEAHKEDCFKQNECRIKMPTLKTKMLSFKNHRNQLKVPYIIYADIETLLKKPEQKYCESQTTTAYQQHEVYSIGYYYKLEPRTLNPKVVYKSKRGPNCIEWFVKEMIEIAREVDTLLHQQKPMLFTPDDQNKHESAQECYICERPFNENETKDRDHCHFSGCYRGAAHKACNLNYQEQRYIPVVFHNLKNYDAHFIIKDFARVFKGKIDVIPQNEERYISFSMTVESDFSKEYPKAVKLRFIDSFQFMASSLDHLSSLLTSEQKRNLRYEFKDKSESQRRLLERKGVFCYDYIDDMDKLNETSLPSKDKFYSQLNESDIPDEDYEFAKKVWEQFEIKTLGEYSDLYMKTDIMLLADIFENFRSTCIDNFKLDPGHYFTAPGLSWDAMLKHTKVEIDLLTDVDMLMFIERGIRGGISQCSKRYSKANNKYMEDYNPENASKYLMYLDANNLYGFSMMQHLPISNFEWCKQEFNDKQILNIADDSSIGYIFEVDLEYPQDLHDEHKDYPFCPENRIVPQTTRQKKLLLTLYNKEKYVIHYKMLKCALRHGLKLQKVHKVLQFEQSQWLKPYIDFNTNLRTNAKNEFDKNFYKLLINSIYGKTMENVRSRCDIQLKTKWDGRYGARKLISLPNFKKFTIFDENHVAIHMNKTNILMDKPITIGMSILDISKVLMYEFYYEHMKQKYKQKVEMLYTDTDSFILEVETDCFYEDMKSDIKMYDTSDYSEKNQFGMPRKNKKVPGLFKDELNGEILTEFVGLRSKMYCVRTNRVEKIKKAKGVKKSVVKKSLTFDDYRKCIIDNCNVVISQNTFRSKDHNVFSIRQTKIALNPKDNKRYVLDDNKSTLPWGHYKAPI